MRRSAYIWVLFALLGLALAAGVSIAASQLSSQRIGLSSEPITAGKRLVPSRPETKPTPRRQRSKHKRRPQPAAPAPVTTQSRPSPPVRAPSSPARQPTPVAPSPAPKKQTTTPRHDDDSRPEHAAQHGDD